ncbi:MAG: 16S rRNA (guanine(527)-N(7))-methyltransferase RsmG [Phycisphaeraceae bacterium]|nr:16S rRNA (guanine(527)-N(7))-methyltransferase RsmG [Phycisphaeraceae bacterium]
MRDRSDPIPTAVQTSLEGLGITVPAPMLDRLAGYLDLLLEANRQFNLTSVRDPAEAWQRHIVDSLTLLPFLEDLPEGARIIDVGTGGGLPGIPLAITRPDLRVTLLESTGKKSAFCDRCRETLPLENARIVNDRAEEAGRRDDHRQQYDAAVCRALGPMRVLLEYTMPLIRVGGMLLAMKGPKAEAELEVSGDALDALGAGALQVVDAYPPQFGQSTVVVVVAKDRATPSRYPRRAGEPKRAPL